MACKQTGDNLGCWHFCCTELKFIQNNVVEAEGWMGCGVDGGAWGEKNCCAQVVYAIVVMHLSKFHFVQF